MDGPGASSLKVIVATAQGQALKDTITVDGSAQWTRRSVSLTPVTQSFQVDNVLHNLSKYNSVLLFMSKQS